jgi:hypothetical protein
MGLIEVPATDSKKGSSTQYGLAVAEAAELETLQRVVSSTSLLNSNVVAVLLVSCGHHLQQQCQLLLMALLLAAEHCASLLGTL